MTYDPISSAIRENAESGRATAIHYTRRGGQLIGLSASAILDRQQEEEDVLGLTVAMSLKYGTKATGEIDWPR